MKTILVTGANGFLGQALLRRLSADRGARVVTVGRRPAGPATARRTHRTADLAKPGWTRALPDRVDAVAHLAQSRHHRDFPAKARDLFDVNVRAGFDLLEWCRTRPGVRLVIASTGSFYAPRSGAIRESDRTEPPTFTPRPNWPWTPWRGPTRGAWTWRWCGCFPSTGRGKRTG
ncbi:MAG: NAD-dependent epimerase/dehydratase family protein [Elusimicrobia bacterium]|nr:NAD-dependent epimerase/dehydratase family protein [Elusimicrobiota bacterium]